MSRSSVTRVALSSTLAVVALTGCTVQGDSFGVTSGLISFNACDSVLGYLKHEALQRVGPYGVDGISAGSGLYAVPLAGAPNADTKSYSPTNVQEAGVDEPDVVKTDGTIIVSTVNGALRVVDVATQEQIGRLDLGIAAGTSELLLDGDKVLVIVKDVTTLDKGPWGQSSRLLSVDLSDPRHPSEVSSLTVEGQVLSARLIDGVVRIATRTDPTIEFDYPHPDGQFGPDDAAARNREIINDSTIEDWLPSARWIGHGQTDEVPLASCDLISHPKVFSGFSTVTVLTVPIGSDLSELDGVGVLGGGDTVYASQQRLYVATTTWIGMGMGVAPGGMDPATAPIGGGAMVAPIMPGNPSTAIHAFDITGDERARYIGSGEVDGRTIGQYAMSEWNGNLRVASTTNQFTADGNDSRVTILAERRGRLVEIGRVDGLGKQQQIYAVRYDGPTAYVVTFEQTDPLYVLDLSDPTAPETRGELEITGYSSYLHPIGSGHVVGVGQEATTDGRPTGAQISLFDVSDPTAPTKLAGDVIQSASSGAEYDPHAFLYWEAAGRIVVPMTSESESGALVLDVGDNTLTEAGWVTHGRDETPMRSFVIDDRLFTLWADGLQSNDFSTLGDTQWMDFS